MHAKIFRGEKSLFIFASEKAKPKIYTLNIHIEKNYVQTIIVDLGVN
jgi:hypothetical protein